ncbi:unnamed protein product [Adineta ricciae]|uniref:BHLH domain-containing protein n=1 Tax=Adineta ricciae TaxID=249248 RepID=A0A815KYZ4_ADIRI|nr:unnamed protein product [Adineta ricciae]
MSFQKCALGDATISDRHYSSSSHLEIILDDHSNCDSIFDDYNSSVCEPKTSTTKDKHNAHQRHKKRILKTPKPHRLIEKRRRDRMNSSLSTLLNLVPHQKNENHKRVEKTEIVEMAIKYIHTILANNQKTADTLNAEKQTIIKLNAYRSGYLNCICDAYEHFEKQPAHQRILPDFVKFSTNKEIELNDLIDLPEKKTLLKARARSTGHGEQMCSASDVQSMTESDYEVQFPIDDGENYPKQIKVPIFVLHPSGTHYVPMHIDSSVVSHVFRKKPNASHPSCANEKAHCHPISIPINFTPEPIVFEPCRLDLQNINVIGTKHQASVRLH